MFISEKKNHVKINHGVLDGSHVELENTVKNKINRFSAINLYLYQSLVLRKITKKNINKINIKTN